MVKLVRGLVFGSLAFALSASTFAASKTYYQVVGAKDSSTLNTIQKDGLGANEEITYAPKLAFPGITLDDIPDGASFFSTIFGPAVNDKNFPVVAIHVQRHTDDSGRTDKIGVQFAIYDSGSVRHTKGVIVVLTNGQDGVYAQRFGQYYVNNAQNLHIKFFVINPDGTVGWINNPRSPTTTGSTYQVKGIRFYGTSLVKTPRLAFPGLTLKDLDSCAFVSGYRIGHNMHISATNNLASYVTAWSKDDVLMKYVMQFTHPNDIYKTAVVQMTDGEGGVYAYQSHYAYNLNQQRFTIDNETGEVTAASVPADGAPQYQAHAIYAIAPCIKKESMKVFSSGDDNNPLTLDDIKDGVFSARFCGSWVDESYLFISGSATVSNKHIITDESGKVTAIVAEFQVRNDGRTKCVVVQFENGEDGVYAKALAGVNHEYPTHIFYQDGQVVGNVPHVVDVAESHRVGAYGVCDVRVTVETGIEFTLDSNKTWSELRNSQVIKPEDLVRIKVAANNLTLTINEDVDISAITFVNAFGTTEGSSTTVDVANGVTFSSGKIALENNVTLSMPAQFAPSNVTVGNNSVLKYSSGEGQAASYSGMGSIEVLEGATLYIDKDLPENIFINNGQVVKRVNGVISIPLYNHSRGVYVVEKGTLKALKCLMVSSEYGFITDEAPNANFSILVKSGAIYDLNGVIDITSAIRLEEGAQLTNTGEDVKDNKKQAVQLILDGNATINATSTLGLRPPSPRNNEGTRIDLSDNTLTVNSAAGKEFFTFNTTIYGSGKVVVNNGKFSSYYRTVGNACTFEVNANGTLLVGGNGMSIADFVNNGVVADNSSELTITRSIQTGNAIPKLTLGDGVVIRLSGIDNAQEVSTTFSASGTITVDASSITKELFRAMSNSQAPVLSVPLAFDPSAVTWKLTNAAYSKAYLKWKSDTQKRTLYLIKPNGLRINVR